MQELAHKLIYISKLENEIRNLYTSLQARSIQNSMPLITVNYNYSNNLDQSSNQKAYNTNLCNPSSSSSLFSSSSSSSSSSSNQPSTTSIANTSSSGSGSIPKYQSNLEQALRKQIKTLNEKLASSEAKLKQQAAQSLSTAQTSSSSSEQIESNNIEPYVNMIPEASVVASQSMINLNNCISESDRDPKRPRIDEDAQN